jgi:hypothetical protein
MDYNMIGIVVVQILLAIIAFLQHRQLEAQSHLVGISIQDLIDRGVIKVIEEEDEDGYY